MKKYISNSREQTVQIAKEFAKTVKKGDIICLNGDLGAGKTTFTQGLAVGLDIKETVNSPTFVIISEYLSGNLPLQRLKPDAQLTG